MSDLDNMDDGIGGAQQATLDIDSIENGALVGGGHQDVSELELSNKEDDSVTQRLEDCQQDAEEDAEEVVPMQDCQSDSEEPMDDMEQDDELNQDEIIESIEQELGIEASPFRPSDSDAGMAGQPAELQEYEATVGAQLGSEDAHGIHIQVHEQDDDTESVIDVQHEPPKRVQAETSEQPQKDLNHQSVHVKHHDNDSSTLFVSPHPSPEPQVSTLQAPSISIPRTAHMSATSSKAGHSLFAKIRSMQKKNADRKNAVKTQAAVHRFNAEPDNEAYLESVMSGITPSASTPAPTVDADEMAHRQALANFAREKRRFEELRSKNNGKLTFRQDVEWMRINGTEQARVKKRERDLAYDRMEDQKKSGLFPQVHVQENEDRSDDSDNTVNTDEPGLSSRKRRRREMPRTESKQLSMQDVELQSMRVALEADSDMPKKKRKSQVENNDAPSVREVGKSKNSTPKKATRTAKSKTSSKAATGGKRRTAKDRREIDNAVKQATSLFTSNVFTQQAGVDAAEQPVWNKPTRNKQDALKELIASVPIEKKQKARSDMNGLIAATRDFNGRGSVKPAGGGDAKLNGWIVTGMKTALKGYQVLGTSFMRRRENAIEHPQGGLMADQMGLGKTLMMLANIVNGRPPAGQHPRTTLLVASPALLSQWSKEIEQHTDCGLKVMRYSSGVRIDSNHADKILKAHDIVLTTYSEVMRSYPKNEPPIEHQTAEQKIAWWKEQYENERGLLHRTFFLRIVLDEAQAIKNHQARTSIACRALMAQHKWALSGTPILNSLSELYPYFKFLGVPHTGSFKIFKHNYCDSGNAENTERLLVRLSQFMIRRTHADEMFGAPILKLPQADQSTYYCEFNSVERCIYDIVENRFAKRINVWAKGGDLDKSYNNALVMLLRLRQLAAHVLMLQFVMQDLLELEDIERIREVVNNQAADGNTRRGRTIIAVRKQLDKVSADQKKKSAAIAAAKAAAKAAGREYVEEDISSNDEAADEDLEEPAALAASLETAAAYGGTGGDFGKEYNFKPFLGSLRSGEVWEKVKKKARCGYCGKQPREAWMTSCGHLICGRPCMEESNLEAAEQEKNYAPCKACGLTPDYIHILEANGDHSPEPVAQGTRSKAAKQKEKQRKRRAHDDLAEDWLASLGDDVLPSAKTIAVKAQIMNWTKENPHVKIIVYTQFLAMIRILARICQNEGWLAEQYHGKMSFAARDKAISAFASDPNQRILLASLRCGGLGLNLTMASKVIMVDPWWNSASEQQAFCRVFRIGQNEQTYMSRLCVKNTIDQRLIAMQDRKQKEIDGVMENKGEWKSRMNIRELMRLFGNLDEDSDGKPFIMVDNPNPMGGFRPDRDDEGYADEF